MKFSHLIILSFFLTSQWALAQGPPITGDKAIMLAPGNKLFKTLTEIRKFDGGEVIGAPLMFHYLPGPNYLLGVHIPYVYYNLESDMTGMQGSTLGDIQLLGKYQFHRNDQMGKTFRVAAKTLQILPTGKELDVVGISTGTYNGYYGIIAGLETIKYGITTELGINHAPQNEDDEIRYKLGFGLPLKKPAYPVDQINLYFEYQSSWFFESENYFLGFAQGIQYAKNQVTVEAAIQLPLAQSMPLNRTRKWSLFLGTRYVF